LNYSITCSLLVDDDLVHIRRRSTLYSHRGSAISLETLILDLSSCYQELQLALYSSENQQTAMNSTSCSMLEEKLAEKKGSVLLPGDEVLDLSEQMFQDQSIAGSERKRPVMRLGGGISQRGSMLVASKAGTLRLESRRNKIWIQNNQKRYTPALEDMVIGVVQDRHADEYRLDINGTDTATLPALAFEGATKKNKPNLTIGSLVYCRITRASKNMEAEASCIEPGSSKSWVGGQTLYGELKGGNVVQVSLGLAKSLLSRNGPILQMLGDKIPFESAVGVNGRVWVQAGSVSETVLLSVAIKNADTLPANQWKQLVSKMLEQASQ